MGAYDVYGDNYIFRVLWNCTNSIYHFIRNIPKKGELILTFTIIFYQFGSSQLYRAIIFFLVIFFLSKDTSSLHRYCCIDHMECSISSHNVIPIWSRIFRATHLFHNFWHNELIKRHFCYNFFVRNAKSNLRRNYVTINQCTLI